MKKTQVKVEFYKDSGKFYTELEFEIETDITDKFMLMEHAKQQKGFIFGMHYTIEVRQGWMWNKWLFTPIKLNETEKPNDQDLIIKNLKQRISELESELANIYMQD